MLRSHFVQGLVISIVFLLVSCQNNDQIADTAPQANLPQFSRLTSDITGVTFQNQINETPTRNIGMYDYFYNGSGVAIADFNNDGEPDIFFCGNDTDNALYFNNGNFEFQEVTARAGVSGKGKWSTGVTVIDINNDGWLDLYVCTSGPYNNAQALTNELYVNNKNGTFTEKAATYGINSIARSTQAVFFDMDRDGDQDLFVMNHSLRNLNKDAVRWYQSFGARSSQEQLLEKNMLYRNDGNDTFTEVTAQSGMNEVGFGLGVSVSDFDHNGYLDLYIANDYFIPDFFYMNQGDGTFVEKLELKASHISYYSMGCDAADINNDGEIDLAVVDMTPADHFRNKTLMASMNVKGFDFLIDQLGFAPQYMFNTLQLNRGYGIFSEIGLMAGVAQTDWSWAALLADFDNDSYKDLMVSNGYWRDTKDNDWGRKLAEAYAQKGESIEVYFEHLQTANSTPIPNYMYRNKGDLTFEDKSEAWAFDEPSFSHGAAYSDLDGDGDLDLVINNLGAEAFIYQNNAREKGRGNYIQFQLEKPGGLAANLHAEVEIFYGEQKQKVEYSFTRGYQSCMEPLAHFGLGEISGIDRAVITWQDGTVSEMVSPAINKRHIVNGKNRTAAEKKSPERAPFVDITSQQQGITFVHRENEFNDFAKEVLLPHRQSQLGPCLAVGDVNGDQLEDFFIGGAKGQPGAIYKQLPSMAFVPIDQNGFDSDAESEDLGAHFLDIEGDGDLDLYVASGGGGEFEGQPNLLQDRLYLNDGAGRFTKLSDQLPSINSSTAVIRAVDWDKDGDLDLFVGGRNVPGKYPQAPNSFLLENEKGTFTDVTKRLAPDIREIGMVTGAEWVDLDKDGWRDLILVGEWMPITVFQNKEGTLTRYDQPLADQELKGWWYQIKPGDFDGDGDQDFIVGNIGLNNKFHPSDAKNLHVFSNDFDDNGTLDIVLSKHYNGDIVPVRGKECSTEQMPFLANKFASYASFASSSMAEIYGAEKLEEALHLQVNSFASIYLENLGDFRFRSTALPQAAQLAPINSIVVRDFDGDGQLDVVVAGNMFGAEVETPAYDAGKGLFLKGLGGGQFESSLYLPETGLFLHKNVKAVEMINLGGKIPGLLVGNNNERPQIYAWRN
jgi:hypothetical protein